MDIYSDLPTTLTAPARDADLVVPNDTVDLPALPRAVYVGGAGSLAVVMAGGQTVTFHGLAAGAILPIRASQILATGTTAGDIVAMW